MTVRMTLGGAVAALGLTQTFRKAQTMAPTDPKWPPPGAARGR
jgi:hypothetical protein